MQSHLFRKWVYGRQTSPRIRFRLNFFDWTNTDKKLFFFARTGDQWRRREKVTQTHTTTISSSFRCCRRRYRCCLPIFFFWKLGEWRKKSRLQFATKPKKTKYNKKRRKTQPKRKGKVRFLLLSKICTTTSHPLNELRQQESYIHVFIFTLSKYTSQRYTRRLNPPLHYQCNIGAEHERQISEEESTRRKRKSERKKSHFPRYIFHSKERRSKRKKKILTFISFEQILWTIYINFGVF